ncbi:MAG: hypothetical protein KAH48_09125 [Chlorobi bacterium]|nr:hypothetical protein [Chlorobiota bacterium]
MNDSENTTTMKQPDDKLVEAIENFWAALRASSERIASVRDNKKIAELRYSEIENNYAELDKKFQALVSQTSGYAVKDDRSRTQILRLEQEKKSLSEMLSNYEHLEKDNYDLRKKIEVLEKSLSEQELLSEKYENLGKDYESQCKEYSENQKLTEELQFKLERAEGYEEKYSSLFDEHKQVSVQADEGTVKIAELSDTIKELKEIKRNFELSKLEIVRKNNILNTNAELIIEQKDRISELKSLTLGKNVLEGQLKISTEEISTLRVEIDQLRKANTDLGKIQEDNELYQKEIDQLKTAVEQVTQEAQSLRTQGESGKSELSARDSIIEQMKNSSLSEITELKATIDEITDLNIEQELEIEQLNILTAEISELEKQVVHTNKLEVEYKAQFDRLNEKLAKRDEMLEAADQRNSEIQDSILTLEAEKTELSKSAGDLLFLKQQMNVTNSQLTLAKTEAMQLRDTSSKLERLNAAIENELREIKDKQVSEETFDRDKAELIGTIEAYLQKVGQEENAG